LPACDLPPWQTVYWYFTACEDSAFFAFQSRAVPDFNRRDTAQHKRRSPPRSPTAPGGCPNY